MKRLKESVHRDRARGEWGDAATTLTEDTERVKYGSGHEEILD